MSGSSVTFTSLLTHTSPERLRALFVKEPTEAAPWVRIAALDGVAEAQLCYGRMLLEGTGIPTDAGAAFSWFSRAAAQGNIEALNMAGRCLDMGWGTTEDPQAAAGYFASAAELGDAWAQYNLGHLYLDGRGVERNHSRAFDLYSRVAAQGHPRAMNLVARCLEEGWGTGRDRTAAADWYRQSAEGGYFRGQYNWATILLATGRAQDAAVWLERAFTSGTPEVRDAIRRLTHATPNLIKSSAVLRRIRQSGGPGP